jgi:hypothetical protein
MTTHNSILSMFWWGIFGYDKAPHPPKSDLNLNYDASQGPALALIVETVAGVLSPEITDKLLVPFTAERFLNKTAYYDRETNDSRIATSWLSKSLMIGGQQFAKTVQRYQ